MDQIKLQVGVKIFLKNKDNKFLLVKRNPEKYKNVKGSWDIVGGRINPGTKLIENLRREVMEETGLEIMSQPRLLCAQDIIPNEQKHVVRLSYVGTTDGDLVLDTKENIDYKWLSLKELLSQEDLDYYVKEIVEKNIL
jgi:ADP-ribose pyrophosphatase YjhB (NUDIX family)